MNYVRASAKNADDHFNDFTKHASDDSAGYFQVDRDIVVAEDISSKSYAAAVKRFADHAQRIEKTVETLAYTPDPPIDSMLHSVQFVVSYGATVTPSWTLISWKGPAINAPGASAQGSRTHILQLALSPRTASTKSTPEQARLIMNAILLSSRP